MGQGKMFEKIKSWIEEEKTLGSSEANNIVLSTASLSGEVHSRVVVIREMTEQGILFFTQKRSQKAKDLSQNHFASMTLWLPLQQREVVLDGVVEALTQDKNARYWEALPRERQLRFLTYKSGEPIESMADLEKDYEILKNQFQDQIIPMGDSYCGYRFVPHRVYFYILGKETFSEVEEYVLYEKEWRKQLVSP